MELHQQPTQAEFKEIVRFKLEVVLDKKCALINPKVKYLTHFFQVAKTWEEIEGEQKIDEIWMVYDATKFGLD